MQPLVSVIIATYNGKEKRFSQTLDSILNQSYKNIELIIINDASTNSIEDVILKYCKKHDNIVYLKNEKNSERSYSRNRGIFESKGKYVAFCDDDDIRNDKDKLKKQVEFLEQNEDHVMCGTSAFVIDQNDKILNKRICTSGYLKILNAILRYNPFIFSSVIIRKTVLFKAGIFNPDFDKTEDYDLWLRICKHGKSDNLKDSFVYYRTRQGNTSTTNKRKMRNQGFKCMLNNLNNYPNRIVAVFTRIFVDFLLPTSVVKMLVKLKKSNLTIN